MSETRKLRYTGERTQSFLEHGVGEVETGDEFEVPGDQAERYLRRDDIEDAAEGKRSRKRPAAAEGDSES